jgi:hypothetical protein
MPRRLRKPPSDPVQAAHSIFAQLTGEEPRIIPPAEKNPAAVALGRLGGAKGGKKRAASMTEEQRKAAAQKAAAARWGKAKS